jgi:molybdopterin-dependent oxidoreductase alpha subunit
MTLRAAGGWHAIFYSLKRARRAGGIVNVVRRLRLRNACKTCALGMGGQLGGMVNERGHFPEVCKKSIQAQTADMQAPIPESLFQTTSISQLARLNERELEDLGRLGFPLIARPDDTHFRRASWEDAIGLTAGALESEDPARVTFYASGRASNEAAFLLQSFARAYGTNNVNNCSYYCHQASGVALTRALGSGTATVTLDDLSAADLAIVVGANPASNHPRLIAELVRMRRRGGKVIVINPLRELGLVRFRIPSDPKSLLFGSTVSDLYLMPNIGGDIAVLKGMLKFVLERGAVDRAFIAAHTEGWDAVEQDARDTDWAAIEAASGLARADIERAAELYAASKGAIFLWAMGITHHAHGVKNVLAIANLAFARGMAGRAGAGLLPIRGHSNVQGVGSVGFTPALRADFQAAMERAYGLRLSSERGLTTFETIEAAHEGRLRVLFHLGGNLYGSNPDSRHAREALSRVETAVFLSTKLNSGHIHGRGRTTVILPVKTRDEESQATTQESMFNYVRLSEGRGTPASSELRSEVEVITEVAARVLEGGAIDWRRLRSHEAVRAEIAKVVPGFRAIGEIDATRREFIVEGRRRHMPDFPTPSGRAHFHVTPIPSNAISADELRLMTIRSEGQFNTVVYEDEDVYRGQTRRDVVMMNAADAERLGFVAGDPVRVVSVAGAAAAIVSFVDIAPGNAAMYYPEANVLVPREIDPESGTPIFKSVVVRVEKDPLRTPIAVRIEEAVPSAALATPSGVAPVPAPAASASNP